ncbi:MAG TPA: OmpA family protein [Telluria sp.]|nr:OmpA family protein [Telluria sp.]
MISRLWKLAAAGVVLALAACSTTPTSTPALESARSAFAAANSDPDVARLAPLEFKQASDAMEAANRSAAKKDALEDIDKLAYLARQKADTAREVARGKKAEEQGAATARERDQVRLQARTAEAESAKAQAAQAQNEAQQARDQAATAQAQAAASEASAREARERLAQYEAVLTELHAVRTARGMVVTINDVLFDTDQATLRPDGMANVQKLAKVLAFQPRRTVLVEGFTDSTGSAAHNQQLSERRAQSVRDALVGMGVDPGRVQMRGYGERFPVAGNRTAADRQLNRRVEIVLSEEGQTIPPR